MIRVRISKELIENQFTTGASHRAFKVTEGVPAHSKLAHVEFDGKEVTLYFAELENVKDQSITITVGGENTPC